MLSQICFGERSLPRLWKAGSKPRVGEEYRTPSGCASCEWPSPPSQVHHLPSLALSCERAFGLPEHYLAPSLDEARS
jgi:hypothetical protein